MTDFDRLNRETQAHRNTCVDRFNPSTRGNYTTSYNTSGYYSPSRTADLDRYNPSTAGNYKYFDPCKSYRSIERSITL